MLNVMPDLLDVESRVAEFLAEHFDSSHNLSHVNNVRNNARLLVNKMPGKASEVNPLLLDLICLLHDSTYFYYKNGVLTYFFEPRLVVKSLNKLGILDLLSQENRRILVTAIRNHPHSFPFRRLNKKRDIYSQILQDADTMEMFSMERRKRLLKRTPKILRPLVRIFWRAGRKSLWLFFNLRQESREVYNELAYEYA